MSLCILMTGVCKTGKSSFSSELIQRSVFKTEKPMELPVTVDTVEMEETVDLADSDVKTDLCSMLEEALQKLYVQEENEIDQSELKDNLCRLYQKISKELTAKFDSVVRAKMEERKAALRRMMVDIQEYIDAIEDELLFDIEAVRSRFQEYAEQCSYISQSAYRWNAKKGSVGHIEHLECNQYAGKNPIRVLSNRRLTEPNQAPQYIGLCLRPASQDKMLGSAA